MKVLKIENLKDPIFFFEFIVLLLFITFIYYIYLLMNTNRRIFILFDSVLHMIVAVFLYLTNLAYFHFLQLIRTNVESYEIHPFPTNK